MLYIKIQIRKFLELLSFFDLITANTSCFCFGRIELSNSVRSFSILSEITIFRCLDIVEITTSSVFSVLFSGKPMTDFMNIFLEMVNMLLNYCIFCVSKIGSSLSKHSKNFCYTVLVLIDVIMHVICTIVICYH